MFISRSGEVGIPGTLDVSDRRFESCLLDNIAGGKVRHLSSVISYYKSGSIPEQRNNRCYHFSLYHAQIHNEVDLAQ